LNACAGGLVAGSFDVGGWNYDGCLIDRARTGLRHDHAAGRQGCCGRCGMGMALGATRRNLGRRGISCGLIFNSENWRENLRFGGGGFVNGRSGNDSGFNCIEDSSRGCRWKVELAGGRSRNGRGR
jgi:hypothetical protein